MVRKYPPLPITKCKTGTMKFPDGRVLHHHVEEEVKHVSKAFPNCCLYIQKLRFKENNEVELRFGYYIIGKTGKSQGKWVWGQFCPSFPRGDFVALIAKAKRAGLM